MKPGDTVITPGGKEKYTISKTTVECYKIRHPKSFYWADITVDHNGSKGRISIASDFGSYQNYWGACGCSFKEFLCKIGIHYAAEKFGADRWFDHDNTIRHFKEQILEYRRSASINAAGARKIFDEIKQLEGTSGESEFCSTLQSLDNLMKFYDWCPALSYSITPQFHAFWKEVWPVFINELKGELKVKEEKK